MAEGVHLLGAEEMGVDELPGVLPVLAQGREGDVGGVVAKDVRGHGPRAGREDVVVGAHDGLGGAGGGDDDGGHGAGAEEEEAVVAVLVDQVLEGDVGLGADVVEVADDGKAARRRRREPQLSCGLGGGSY